MRSDVPVLRQFQCSFGVDRLDVEPEIFAVALEYLMFGERPSALTFAGIAVTCAGVALVSARPR